MSVCHVLARLVFIGFFTLTAFNNIENLTETSESLAGKYKGYQNRVSDLTGLNFHPYIHHETVSQHSEDIIFWFSVVVAFLSISSIIRPEFGKVAAFLWFKMQLLEHEVFNLTHQTPLKQIEILLMSISVFIAALCVFCKTKNK